MPKIRFTLNGAPTEASYEPGMHFLEVLREECGVSSVKNGCAPEGACGACLVMIDGKPALSCLRKRRHRSRAAPGARTSGSTSRRSRCRTPSSSGRAANRR